MEYFLNFSDSSSITKTSPRHTAEEKEAQLLAEEQRLAKKYATLNVFL